MDKKQKILVVGGTGFLGKHILKKSLKLGYSPTSISLKKLTKIKKIKGVDYINLDIRKKKEFRKITIKFDYVVNVGGYGGIKKKFNPYEGLESQYIGLKNLAGYFLNKKLKKFVQIGSSLEYGNNKSPNFEKMVPKLPLTDYGKVKLKATNHLKFLHQFYDFPVVILRLYQVYGPGQDKNRLLGYLLNSIKNKKIIKVSKGDQMRDFLYISDFIEALFRCLKEKKTEGEIINIGQGSPIKIKTLINKTMRFFSAKKTRIKFSIKNSEIKTLYPSINKAKRLIRWKPKIKIETGLRKLFSLHA